MWLAGAEPGVVLGRNRVRHAHKYLGKVLAAPKPSQDQHLQMGQGEPLESAPVAGAWGQLGEPGLGGTNTGRLSSHVHAHSLGEQTTSEGCQDQAHQQFLSNDILAEGKLLLLRENH